LYKIAIFADILQSLKTKLLGCYTCYNTTSQMKYVVGVGGMPLMVANKAVPDGLKKMSDAVPVGPKGGVVCCRAEPRERVFLSCTVNPLAWPTEKQITPATAPPFRIQAATT
jgi:hypothetical protein